jgi:hypothetical protein
MTKWQRLDDGFWRRLGVWRPALYIEVMTISDSTSPQNPLLADWTGAFGLPPFATLTPEHFRPAFDRALAAG